MKINSVFFLALWIAPPACVFALASAAPQLLGAGGLSAPGEAKPPAVGSRLEQSRGLFTDKCSACHDLPKPEQMSYTRDEWQRTVTRMLTKYEASESISQTEASQIVNYLATFSPDNHHEQTPLDPWSTGIDDVWTHIPARSLIVNFSSGEQLNGLPRFNEGPGPKPLWRVAPDIDTPSGHALQVRWPAGRSAGKTTSGQAPNHTGLLVIPHSYGHDIDIHVRVRMDDLSGKGAAGIAFGIPNGPNSAAKGADLAGYSQSGDCIALLRDTAGQGPIAPAELRLSTANTVGSAWHALRVMVKGDKVRVWIDGDKRVRVTDPGYAGGAVGLFSQGGVDAAFDGLIVDEYDPAPVVQGPTIAVPDSRTGP